MTEHLGIFNEKPKDLPQLIKWLRSSLNCQQSEMKFMHNNIFMSLQK